MCCRYYMEMSPELRPIVEAAQRSRLYKASIEKVAKPLITEGEVFPDSMVPVIATSKSGEKSVFPMVWGFHVPGISRTIVPASWYYEWEHVPTPSGKSKAGSKYAIMPKGGELTWLCGLYRLENNFPHFVILTREPGESIAFIHDRMPFILPESKVDAWIDPERNPHMLLGSAVTDVIFEKDAQGKAPT